MYMMYMYICTSHEHHMYYLNDHLHVHVQRDVHAAVSHVHVHLQCVYMYNTCVQHVQVYAEGTLAVTLTIRANSNLVDELSSVDTAAAAAAVVAAAAFAVDTVFVAVVAEHTA